MNPTTETGVSFKGVTLRAIIALWLIFVISLRMGFAVFDFSYFHVWGAAIILIAGLLSRTGYDIAILKRVVVSRFGVIIAILVYGLLWVQLGVDYFQKIHLSEIHQGYEEFMTFHLSMILMGFPSSTVGLVAREGFGLSADTLSETSVLLWFVYFVPALIQAALALKYLKNYFLAERKGHPEAPPVSRTRG